MPQPNVNVKQPAVLAVRPTYVNPGLTEETMSSLGRELLKLAREIEASDEAALDEAGIERELQRRRGGFTDVQS
jgi:hypothetical protein